MEDLIPTLGCRSRYPAWTNHMIATATAKSAYMRSDGRFFIAADTVSGSFSRGDVVAVPLGNMLPFKRKIDGIYFVGTKIGSQQSLMFKNVDAETEQLLSCAVVDGMMLEIFRGTESRELS